MKYSADDIAQTVKNAKLSDSLKEKLIVKLAAARLKMTDVEFSEFFEKIKEKISETEKMLN